MPRVRFVCDKTATLGFGSAGALPPTALQLALLLHERRRWVQRRMPRQLAMPQGKVELFCDAAVSGWQAVLDALAALPGVPL
jgi:8-oxo-dGTP pyrophosphatase MutT (NUDIX family)